MILKLRKGPKTIQRLINVSLSCFPCRVTFLYHYEISLFDKTTQKPVKRFCKVFILLHREGLIQHPKESKVLI